MLYLSKTSCETLFVIFKNNVDDDDGERKCSESTIANTRVGSHRSTFQHPPSLTPRRHVSSLNALVKIVASRKQSTNSVEYGKLFSDDWELSIQRFLHRSFFIAWYMQCTQIHPLPLGALSRFGWILDSESVLVRIRSIFSHHQFRPEIRLTRLIGWRDQLLASSPPLPILRCEILFTDFWISYLLIRWEREMRLRMEMML